MRRNNTPKSGDSSDLKWFVSLCKPHAPKIAAVLGATGLSQITTLSLPKVVGHVTGLVVAGNPVIAAASLPFLAGTVGLVVMGSVGTFIRNVLSAQISSEITALLRRKVTTALFVSRIETFEKEAVGDLSARVVADCAALGDLLADPIPNFIRNIVTVVGCLTMMAYTSPQLTFTVAVILLGAIPASMTFGRVVQRLTKATADSNGAVGAFLTERISGIVTVKAFAVEKVILRDANKRIDDVAALMRRSGKVNGYFYGGLGAFIWFVMIAIVCVGGHMVSTGAMAAADLTTFLLYAVFLVMNGMALGMAFASVKKGLGFASRVRPYADAASPAAFARAVAAGRTRGAATPAAVAVAGDAATATASATASATSTSAAGTVTTTADAVAAPVAAESPLVIDPASFRAVFGSPTPAPVGTAAGAAPTTLPACPETSATHPLCSPSIALSPNVSPSVSFENVTFSYPRAKDRLVLDGFTLTVAPGEVVAIVGESGSGKSTVAALLLGLYAPNAGAVTVGGHPVEETDIRGVVGYVPQATALFSGTVADNVALGASPDLITATVAAETAEAAAPATDADTAAPVAKSDDATTPNPAAAPPAHTSPVTTCALDGPIHRALTAALARDFVDALPNGIHTDLGVGGGSLSGGQRQRLAVARALLRAPPLLVFDEATASLDRQAAEGVISSICGIVAAGRSVRDHTGAAINAPASTTTAADGSVDAEAPGVRSPRVEDARKALLTMYRTPPTVIMITHHAAALTEADRVVVVKGGKVAECGKYADLLANPDSQLRRVLHA